jgi:hypothetical protein
MNNREASIFFLPLTHLYTQHHVINVIAKHDLPHRYTNVLTKKKKTKRLNLNTKEKQDDFYYEFDLGILVFERFHEENLSEIKGSHVVLNVRLK